MSLSENTANIVKVGNFWLPASDTHFKKAIKETGSYMPERIQAAMSYCTTKRMAVDVGAHVGIYTYLMMAEFSEVYAFEPSADNFACLERNTANVPGRAILNRCAVGQWPEWGTLHQDPLPKRAENSGARYIERHETQQPDSVAIVTLDAMNLSACDFLKIDVEGMELDVLEGAYQTLTKHHPVIMLEIGKAPEERYHRETNAPLEFLAAMGWDIVLEMRGDKVLTWQPE